jgi:5-methylcytosine-specific restriction endonuclease McrA
MPPTKQAPPRNCAECGRLLTRKRYNGRLEDFGVFQRRTFCDTRCMAISFDKRTSTASSTKAKTGNYHARKMVPPGPCMHCGKPSARDVHHLNGDRNDNRPENLTRLCRGCHLRRHRYAPQTGTTATAVPVETAVTTS